MKYNEKAWLFLILPFNNSAAEWFKAGDDNYLFTSLVNGVLIEMEAQMLELIQIGQRQVIHSIFCINHLSEKWPASQFHRNPYPEATFKKKMQCFCIVKHGGGKRSAIHIILEGFFLMQIKLLVEGQESSGLSRLGKFSCSYTDNLLWKLI